MWRKKLVSFGYLSAAFGMIVGASGCHHHHYYYGGRAVGPNGCDPVVMMPQASAANVCDVPTKVSGGWTSNEYPSSRAEPLITGAGRPKRIVISEPTLVTSGNVRSPETPSGSVAVSTKVESGGFDDSTQLK